MRRIPVWVWAVGVAVACAGPPGRAAAGVWVTLAAGLPGATAPAADADLWFDTPHAPPFVAVTSVPGSVEAGTAGGSSFFGGLGLPVLLNLSDGSAYLAGGGAPDAARTRGPAGAGAGTRASAGPVTNATVPSTAALLGLTLGEPNAAGAKSLTATLTDAAGATLGTGTVAVPDGGWYVVGLGPTTDTPPPPVVDPPTPPPPVVDPPVTPPTTDPVPPTTPSPGDHPVATPEPAAIVLVAAGGAAAGVARRFRGRKSA